MNDVLNIKRDQYGFYLNDIINEVLSSVGEDCTWKDVAEKLNIKLAFTYLEFDADDCVVEKYFDGDITACLDWNPTQPDGDGWKLLSIHDHEDGAVAVWGIDND